MTPSWRKIKLFEPLNLKPIELWLEALRSKQYIQGNGLLHFIDESNISKDSFFARGHDNYCCFGVACDVYLKYFGNWENNLNEHFSPLSKKFLSDDGMIYAYDGETLYLPDKVRKWLGLNSNSGTFNDGQDSLMSMNDRGYSFSEIADFIATNPKGLFRENY